jgi:hypothetical protein
MRNVKGFGRFLWRAWKWRKLFGRIPWQESWTLRHVTIQKLESSNVS